VSGYREIAPPAALAPWVQCGWRRGDARPARVLPDGCIDLVWTPDRGLHVVGANSVAFLAPLAAGAEAVGVRFHPGAARPLIRLAPPELRDVRAPAADLLGDPAARLEEAMEAAPGAPAAVALLFGWLAERARGAAAPDPLVAAAVAGLGAAGRTADVAWTLGVSERGLRRRVTEEVGYGPKRLARVLRLQRALAAARAGVPLARVAYASGYADQAHFAGDCAALAGEPPTAILAA
jgi:AraC-like DNA-binding protein